MWRLLITRLSLAFIFTVKILKFTLKSARHVSAFSPLQSLSMWRCFTGLLFVAEFSFHITILLIHLFNLFTYSTYVWLRHIYSKKLDDNLLCRCDGHKTQQCSEMCTKVYTVHIKLFFLYRTHRTASLVKKLSVCHMSWFCQRVLALRGEV